MKPKTTKVRLDPLIGSSADLDTSPPEFPLKFKVMLRRIIGGKRYAERLRLFRKFWCSRLKYFDEAKGVRTRESTEEGRIENTNELITAWVGKGVDESSFKLVSRDFPIWRVENRQLQRKAAAESRWLKEKKNKTVDRQRRHKK